MSVPPSVSSNRGQAVLQPEYFTSNIYVDNLKRDIASLLNSYREQYSQSPGRPFALFKSIWLSQRWEWLLFKVFDSRSREAFLTVTLRLFLERVVPNEDSLTRTTALFGFYTFFYSQPKDTAPPLHFVSHIPIPIDHYSSLRELPSLLTRSELQPLQPYVVTVLSILIRDDVFYILPRSSLSANNPRELPREEVTDETTNMPMETGKRKRGRPTKQDKAKKGMAAIAQLEKKLQSPSLLDRLTPNDPTQDRYLRQKQSVLDILLETEEGSEAIERASEVVVQGLRQAKELVEGQEGSYYGLERVERAKTEAKGGLLCLRKRDL